MGTANEGLARTELNRIFDWYDNDEKWGEREWGLRRIVVTPDVD